MKIRAQNNRSIWTCFFFLFFLQADRQATCRVSLGERGLRGSPALSPVPRALCVQVKGSSRGAADVGVWFKISLSQAEMWWMKLYLL